MDWSKCFESVERNAESFERFNLVSVPEDEPEVPSQVQDFRGIAEQELLIPMRMPVRIHQNTHDLVVFIRISVFVQTPSKLYNFNLVRYLHSNWAVLAKSFDSMVRLGLLSAALLFST